MNTTRYRALCRYAGEWLDEPAPFCVPLDELHRIRACCGVYVVCEPLGRVQYVGSVCRPGSAAGVADRLREHLREGHKRLRWTTAWVIPLRRETSSATVRAIEACVGVDLEPRSRNRLPRLLSA